MGGNRDGADGEEVMRRYVGNKAVAARRAEARGTLTLLRLWEASKVLDDNDNNSNTNNNNSSSNNNNSLIIHLLHHILFSNSKSVQDGFKRE